MINFQSFQQQKLILITVKLKSKYKHCYIKSSEVYNRFELTQVDKQLKLHYFNRNKLA